MLQTPIMINQSNYQAAFMEKESIIHIAASW
jgi:hypothetical protein